MTRITKKLNNEYSKIEVVSFTGLVVLFLLKVSFKKVDFAKERNVDFLIRGLRAYSDFEAEFRMALVNRKLTGIETVKRRGNTKLIFRFSS